MPIPVQRAETFYLPPRPLPLTAWDLVPPAERCARWYEIKQQRGLRLPAGFLIGQKTWARINHNRWLADCPCGSAQVVSPDDARLACVECSLGWLTVVFPADVAAAEAAVADELPHLRNWWNPDDPDAWDRPADATPDPSLEDPS